MQRKSGFFRILVVVLAFGMVLGTAASTLAAEKLTKVRLSEVVRSIFYAPQYVALALGFFEDEGLEIELSTAWGAHNGAAALISGDVDVGFFGPEASVYIYQQGAENHIIGFAQLTAKDGSFLMSREYIPDFTWEDVKGKVIIGARKGGVPQMMLEWILKQHGIEMGKDVEVITHLAFTAAAGAFQSGLGDFVAQFEPTLSELEAQGVGYFVASLGVDGGDVTYTVYHVRKDYLEKHPDIIQRFTNAIYRGQRWVHSHTVEEIVDVVTPYFPGVSREIMIKATERYRSQDSWTRTPEISRSSFEHLLRVMINANELKQPVPFDELMTNDFARRAVELAQ